ncbi:MAG: DUF2845 domain-containing protein [Thermodesulforhabdaceae bacterium]
MTGKISSVKRCWLVVGFVTLLFANTTLAVDCIRCSGNLVCEGDGESQLISICGKPDYVEDKGIIKVPLGSGAYAYQPAKVFYYNCGSNRLDQFITITGGTVTKIRAGNRYGSGIPRCNE